MNTCYDGRQSVKLIVLLAVLSMPVQAQVWTATVEPPRRGLPAVTIELGYPGPYVPSINSPITLRAIASEVPFDGYIGYHFEVDGRSTLDTPVIARAIVQPRGAWSFNTFLTMRVWGGTAAAKIVNRELVIEWRDRALNLTTKKTAGMPAWSAAQPLRIADARTPLPDRAQWYTGFWPVVAPLETWIDLPRNVRDAILGSMVHIVLTGLPRANQREDDLDRALIPVTFTATPGAYDRPWPYERAHVQTPMSWRAKDGADFAASASCPYIVMTNAATWIADDAALSRGMPAMTRSDGSRSTFDIVGFDPYDLKIDYRPLALSGGMLILSACAWLFVRARSLFAVAIAVVAVTLSILAVERRRISAPAAMKDHVVQMPVAPEIVDEIHVLNEHGPAPLPERAADRMSISGDFGFPEIAEERSARTAASMGILHHRIDWDSTLRWTMRRRIAPSSAPLTRFITPHFGDYHSAMTFWSSRRPRAGSFDIHSNLTQRSDGMYAATFALPPNTNGVVRVIVPGIIANDEIMVISASGTTRLAATRRNAYSPPTATMPDALVRDIINSGGIFEIAVTRAKDAVAPVFWASIRVQEKKS